MACEDKWAIVDSESALLDQAILNQQQWSQTVIFRSQSVAQAMMEAIACEYGSQNLPGQESPAPNQSFDDVNRLQALAAEFKAITARNLARLQFNAKVHRGVFDQIQPKEPS